MVRIAQCIVAFIIAVCSAQAGAAVVTGGFSGEIFGGSDFGSSPAGFFGAGADLTGQRITGTFRYDTAQVPAGQPMPPNEVVYQDPTFNTHFLDFTVTINGTTYTFGTFPTAPGIQSIDVIDNTDQLQFDFQRFGVNFDEAISLRFISAIDFLTGTGVPTEFTFVPGGVGLFPTGSFSFDLPNGDFASARFDIDGGFARLAVPEPRGLSLGALALLAVIAMRRRSAQAC
jgi:hypothetical protein